MSVLRQIEEHSYLVSIGGDQHVVDSTVALEVGAQVRTVVVAVGDRLELKYLDSDAASARSEEPEPSADSSLTLLANLEQRYRLTLSAKDHETVEHAAAHAADPNAMALAGMFLAKLGAAVDLPNLDALHRAQRAPEVQQAPTAPREIARVAPESTAELAQSLANALSPGVSPGPALDTGREAGSGDSGSPDSKDLAHWLLNLQDGGSVAYHYGTVPLLVSGQLIELDLVHFQPRQPQAGGAQVRRLVMTLDTQHFGPLRIEARALEDRLMVMFTSETPQSSAELATYADDIRGLASRFGWKVEAVGYDYNSPVTRAARQVMEHVLSSGTVDKVL